VDPYGLRRVLSPAGALPQRADVLDPGLPLGEDELSLDVEALAVDAASFRQLERAAEGDPARIAAEVQAIVRGRGKLHNPVTGSGGMLLGRVAEVGPHHPAAGTLHPGDRVATLVSLTLTPLRLDRIHRVRPELERIDCEGRAILFASGSWARLPGDLPEELALSVLDVCGAPALAGRLLRPGQRVLVVGAGKSGALVLARARELLGGSGLLAALDRSEGALEGVRRAGLCDVALAVDATDAVATLRAVEGAGGPFDLVVSCASLPGTEMSALLAVRDGGTVLFFSMATSFTAAALGAEGIARDATLLVGNGYVPGHAELALDLLRRTPALRALLASRGAAPTPAARPARAPAPSGS
jgi:L-erythro-3,5-diaminohexanoate dehydrogenase